MTISSVSFGQVIAVSGKPHKANYLRNELLKVQGIDVISANDHFKSSSSNGLLLQAARRGDDVDIYVTGDDCEKYHKKEDGYVEMEDVLSKINRYFNLRNVSTKDAKEGILTF